MSYDSESDSRDGATRNTRIPENDLGPTARRRIGSREQIYSTTCPWLEQQLNEVIMSMIFLVVFQGKNSESLGSFGEFISIAAMHPSSNC